MLVLLAIIDVVTGKWRLPLLRLGLMAIVIALHEWYAVGLFLRLAPLRGAARTQALERAMGTVVRIAACVGAVAFWESKSIGAT